MFGQAGGGGVGGMLYHWSVNAHALQTCTLSRDGGDKSRLKRLVKAAALLRGATAGSPANSLNQESDNRLLVEQ